MYTSLSLSFQSSCNDSREGTNGTMRSDACCAMSESSQRSPTCFTPQRLLPSAGLYCNANAEYLIVLLLPRQERFSPRISCFYLVIKAPIEQVLGQPCLENQTPEIDGRPSDRFVRFYTVACM